MSSTIESVSISGTSSAAVLEPDTTEKNPSGVPADVINKKLKRNLNEWSESGSVDSCLEKLEEGLKKLSSDSVTDQQLAEQKELHQLFAADWTGTSEQMVLISELGAFDVILARNSDYLKEQQKKLEEIRELQRLEKIKIIRNRAFDEMFSVIHTQVRINQTLIEEITRLKEALKLTPEENVIFDIVLIKLHGFLNELKKFSEPFLLSDEEYQQFQEKSEEEQVEFIEKAFSAGANALEIMEHMIPAMDAAFFYWDEIIFSRGPEIGILIGTGANGSFQTAMDGRVGLFNTPENLKEFKVPALWDRKFSVRTFIPQVLTRMPMPAMEVIKSLQLEAEKEKVKSALTQLNELGVSYDKIRRENMLCTNIFNAASSVSPSYFLEDAAKEKAFKTFLEKKSDRKKIAQFNLLRKLYKSDSVDALKENEKKIRQNFPFLKKVLDELDKEGTGYVLNLVKIFPGYLDLDGRKINLARNAENGSLMYAVRNRDGVVVKGHIDIKVEEDFSLSALNEIKEQILDEIAKQGYIIGKQEEEQQRKEKMRLAHNTIKSLLLDIFEADFKEFIIQGEVNAQFPLERSNPMERISGFADKAEKAINSKIRSVIDAIQKGPFFGARADFCAKASYFNYVSRAWDFIQDIQNAKKDDPSTEGWKLMRKRSNGTYEEQCSSKVSKRFRKGDPALIYQKDELVCTVTPQKMSEDAENEFSGVGVEMHRHEKKDMILAVHIMAAAMGKKEKKICITLDFKASDADDLALKYADAILSQCITPILCDGSRELSVEETEAKLIELIARVKEKGNKNYNNLVEQYRAHLETVAISEKEDEAFLVAYKEFLEKSPSLLMQYPLGGPLLKKDEIILKLATAFRNRNLTTQDFIDGIVNCAQKMLPTKEALLSTQKVEELKEELRVYIERCISDELLELKKENFEVYFAKQIYNMAAAALGPEIDLELYSDYFFPSALEQKEPALRVELANKAEKASSEKTLAQDLKMKVTPEEILEKDVEEPSLWEQPSEDFLEFESHQATNGLDKFNLTYKDYAFLEKFDDLLKELAVSFSTTADVSMIDPNTNQVLSAQEILKGLAEIFMRKHITESEFIDKIIAFGWYLSPQYADGKSLSDEKRETLKHEIEKRLAIDHKHTETYIEHLVSKLVEFAQQEFIPGHISKALSGRNGFISGTTCAASVGKEADDAILTPSSMVKAP